MKFFFRIFFLFLFFSLSFSTHAFSDSEYGASNRLLERGVISEAELFYPDNRCTRATFVKWAVLNTGAKINPHKNAEPFADVRKNPFIAEAWRLGVLPTKKVFFPRRSISKIDALEIALKLEGVAIPRSDFEEFLYDDFPSDFALAGVVKKALAMHIVFPETEDHFGTETKLTRLECAQILDALFARRKAEYENQNTFFIPREEAVVSDVLDVIERKFLYSDTVEKEKLLQVAVGAMVDALGDPYTNYFSPEGASSFLTNVGIGKEYGIGAQVGINADGQLVILRPLRNGPAEKSGVLAGDIILSVDGVDVAGGKKTLEEIVALIKGDRYDPVNITFLRREKEVTITIIRDTIRIETVLAREYDGYLLIELQLFAGNTMREFLEALRVHESAAKKGIILDLRNNPGGLLNVVINLSALFLPDASIAVYTKDQNVLHGERISSDEKWLNVPMIVLVNENSASASEILAGALQDHKRARVIGTQTFGKGTAQELLQFPDGSALKITIAEWLTPLKRSINKIGITPDYVFKNTDDSEAIWSQAARMIRRGQWRL